MVGGFKSRDPWMVASRGPATQNGPIAQSVEPTVRSKTHHAFRHGRRFPGFDSRHGQTAIRDRDLGACSLVGCSQGALVVPGAPGALATSGCRRVERDRWCWRRGGPNTRRPLGGQPNPQFPLSVRGAHGRAKASLRTTIAVARATQDRSVAILPPANRTSDPPQPNGVHSACATGRRCTTEPGTFPPTHTERPSNVGGGEQGSDPNDRALTHGRGGKTHANHTGEGFPTMATPRKALWRRPAAVGWFLPPQRSNVGSTPTVVGSSPEPTLGSIPEPTLPRGSESP